MESQSQSSYQEDILKVKKIWHDLKEVQKIEKRNQKQKHSKQENMTKVQTGLNQKGSNKLSKVKSQDNIKSTPQKKNQQIISFSTVSPRIAKYTKHIPNSTVFIESFNQRQKIEKKDEQISLLRITNQKLKDEIKNLENKLYQKDQLIEKLKNREYELLGQTMKNKNQQVINQQSSVEYINYKNDTARLLKMLQTTKEFKQFAQLAIEDNGVRFLHQANRHKKSIIDAIDQKKANVHFCSCNGQFLQQQNLWVPQKAYDFANQFIQKKRTEYLTSSELQLMLYELNRIWREREKKILNSADSLKALQVDKYKRRIQQIQRFSGKKVKSPQ